MLTRTPEETRNIYLYGLCQCGAIRKPEMLWTTTDDSESVCTHALVCENGHEQ